jgi:signal transduction histidine kinase
MKSKDCSVKGSGIGLSLVNTILKLHRVELTVVSQLGQGTTAGVSTGRFDKIHLKLKTS